MEEQSQEPTVESTDERPKIFGSVNGWIAGVTGLLVAMGGLFTAYDRMRGDKPAQPQAVAATTPQPGASKVEGTAAVQPDSETAPARRRIYTGELYAEGKLDGGAMSLRHDGENWILSADQRYVYEQLAASGDDQIRAYNRDYDSYLRWPVNGGDVEERLGQASWNPYAKVSASEPSSQ